MESSLSDKMISKSPIRLVIKFTLPTILLLFFTGIYSFVDDIMSVRMASDNYRTMYNSSLVPTTSRELIRLAISITLPISILISSITIIFSIGTVAKYSRALATGDNTKADKVSSTAVLFSFITSGVVILLLMFFSKTWLDYQYHGEPLLHNFVTKLADKYISIIVFSLPFQLYSNVVASIIRANGRTLLPTIFISISVGLNIFLNFIFMDVGSFGLEGSAYATLIAWVFSSILFLQFQSFTTNERIKFKNSFNIFNMSSKFLLPIIWLGFAPFIQQAASSVTETFESKTVIDLSNHLFHKTNVGVMPAIYSAMIPVYNIWSPLIFGFVLGVTPIATYMHSMKEKAKLRRLLMVTLAAMILFSVITFFTSSHTFTALLPLLGVKDYDAITEPANSVFRIIMISEFFLAISSFSVLYFISINMNYAAVFCSMLRPALVMVMMPVFFHLSYDHYDNDQFIELKGYDGMFAINNLYWWFYPSASALAAMIVTLIIFANILVDKVINQKFNNQMSSYKEERSVQSRENARTLKHSRNTHN